MNYLEKLNKYDKKLLGGAGEVNCPFKPGQIVEIKSDNSFGKIEEIIFSSKPGNICTTVIVRKYLPGNRVLSNDSVTLSSLSIRSISDVKFTTDIFINMFTNLRLEELINIYRSNIDQQMREAINLYPFDFYNQSLSSTVTFTEFRNIFRNAIGINLENHSVNDAEFRANMIGNRVTKLKINRCMNITDAIFQDLINLEELDIYICDNIGNGGFQYLTNLKILNLYRCYGINDTAFHHLQNIQRLFIYRCYGITNEAFRYLSNLQDLELVHCQQITDDALQYLGGLYKLEINDCSITGTGYRHLRGLHTFICRSTIINNPLELEGIHTLDISGCFFNINTIFDNLHGIHNLNISSCNSDNPDIGLFNNILGINELNMSNFNLDTYPFTVNFSEKIKGIKILNIRGCENIPVEFFTNLSNIHTLNIRGCDQVTDDSIASLQGIHTLNMCETDITDNGLKHLYGIKRINVRNCPNITAGGINILKVFSPGVEILQGNGVYMQFDDY
jgi:hypothetical protein